MTGSTKYYYSLPLGVGYVSYSGKAQTQRGRENELLMLLTLILKDITDFQLKH